MKNVINYYYQLFPSDIHQTKDYYTFKIENINYLFLPFKKTKMELEQLYELSENLIYNQILVHQIIKNKMGEFVTFVNNNSFVLLKVYVNSNQCIILNDILKFQKQTLYLANNEFSKQKLFKMWTEKIDYFEYQVSQFGTHYPFIRESFNYFIGLSENAISLLNEIDEKNIKQVLSHHRLKATSTYFQLYHCLELIMDSKIRDIVEYFKDKSLYINCIDEMIYYIEYEKLNKDEAILFFARFLFPTFYFDLYEKIIDKTLKEDKIKVAIDFVPRYEQNCKQLYYYLKNKYPFPEIEWLIPRIKDVPL